MTRFPTLYGTRVDDAGPGADPEDAIEREWERADAAYEIWRDDEVLNRAVNRLTKDEHNQLS